MVWVFKHKFRLPACLTYVWLGLNQTIKHFTAEKGLGLNNVPSGTLII